MPSYAYDDEAIVCVLFPVWVVVTDPVRLPRSSYENAVVATLPPGVPTGSFTEVTSSLAAFTVRAIAYASPVFDVDGSSVPPSPMRFEAASHT